MLRGFRRAVRRGHRRVASAAPRGHSGVPRPHRDPSGARARDRARGTARILPAAAASAYRAASPSHCGCAAASRATPVHRQPGRVARRHRQAGRRRARAGQRLHRFIEAARRHKPTTPAAEIQQNLFPPASPGSRAPNWPARSYRATTSAATGLTSSRTATAPGWRSPTPPAKDPPPPASAPPRSARCAPRAARTRPRAGALPDTRNRSQARQPRLLRDRPRGSLARRHREADVGQLRTPPRLPRRHRRQSQPS